MAPCPGAGRIILVGQTGLELNRDDFKMLSNLTNIPSDPKICPDPEWMD